MPDGKDPLKPTSVGKATPRGPVPLMKAPPDPTKTVTALARPSRLNPHTRAMASPKGVQGFTSQSVDAGIPSNQGVGHFLQGPGGASEKKPHGGPKAPSKIAVQSKPTAGGANTRTAPATAAQPTNSGPPSNPKPPVDRKQFLADRRAMLADIVERKRAGTLPPRKASPPGGAPGASGANLKPATPGKAAPRAAGPSEGSRVVHTVPTKVFGDVHVRETAVPGKPPEYGVHPSTMNPEHWARLKHTAEAMGGRAHDGALKFDTPRAAKEFADSLAVDPKRRRVREDELGRAVVEELDHADEFDLGGEPSKEPKATTGIKRARSRPSQANQADARSAEAGGTSTPTRRKSAGSPPRADTASAGKTSSNGPGVLPPTPATGSGDSSRQILEAMAKADPATSTGAPITFDRLRPHLAGPLADKDTFDKAVLQMGRDGLVSLHRHDFPAGQPEDAIRRMVPDGRGNGEYYFTISRRSTAWEPQWEANSSAGPTSTPKASSGRKPSTGSSNPAASVSGEPSPPRKPRSRKPNPAAAPSATDSGLAANGATAPPANPKPSPSPASASPAAARGPAESRSSAPTRGTPSRTASDAAGPAKSPNPGSPEPSTSSNATRARSTPVSNRAASVAVPESFGAGTAPIPTKAASATPAKAKEFAGSRAKPADFAEGPASFASRTRRPSSPASTATAKASTEVSADPEDYEWTDDPSSPMSPVAAAKPSKADPGRSAKAAESTATTASTQGSIGHLKALHPADQAMAKRHLSKPGPWTISGKQHSNHSRSLGNAIHWALRDATEGHGSPEIGKVGPYTLETDVSDGKVKGLFLKLRGNRYKVDLDREGITGHDPGGHITDSIKRAMRSIAGSED